MPTMDEIGGPDGYRAVPQVPRNEVEKLWYSDFWDGPRSGMAVFRGERCWFQVVAENDDEDLAGWYRRFAIVRLSPEQLIWEERWHALFCESVGWHTDYRADATGRYQGLRPREQWSRFYDLYEQRVPLSLATNAVLGWFEL